MSRDELKQVRMGGDAKHTEVVMHALAEVLMRMLPAGLGFTLFVFDVGVEEGHVSYISSADRRSMLTVVREWLRSQGGRDS